MRERITNYPTIIQKAIEPRLPITVYINFWYTKPTMKDIIETSVMINLLQNKTRFCDGISLLFNHLAEVEEYLLADFLNIEATHWLFII